MSGLKYKFLKASLCAIMAGAGFALLLKASIAIGPNGFVDVPILSMVSAKQSPLFQ